MTTTIGSETMIARNNSLPAATVDDDLVILNIARQSYVGLDAIGRAVWDELAEPQRVDAVCRTMATRYADTSGALHADVEAFLGEMLAEGLIVVAA
jgi:hypothetical protein